MNRFVSLLALSIAMSVNAADLVVANREPTPEEIGYRPADASTNAFNPPSFAWLLDRSARKWTVQWAHNAEFASAVTVSNLNFNCYTHNQPFEPGQYFWRYKFLTEDGKESDWSITRRFVISTNAILFPMPSTSERRQLVPKAHPRLFVRPEDLPRLRAQTNGLAGQRFRRLKADADKIVESPLVKEPTVMGSAQDKHNLELLKNWWPNRDQTVHACTDAETVAFLYLLTREPKYAEAARKRVLDLASWNPDGPTNFRTNCEAAKPLLYRLSRAYDWTHDLYSPEERSRIQAAVKRRIHDAWESGEVGRGYGHINRPLNSHGNRVWHKIGESGIVFLDEIPEADLWLDYALNKFYTCYPVWSDADGGWHEGAAYYAGYMSKAVWWLEIARSALNIDGYKKPFFAQVGDFPLYMAPPHSPNLGFGDLSYHSALQGWGSFMEFFVRTAGTASTNSHAAYWRWWSEQWKQSPANGILGFLYEAMLPPIPEAVPPSNLPPSKIFRGIGLASFHTTLLDSSNDVHFLFKSDPFGSQSHGHNPQNTFQINGYGESLIAPCVLRDFSGTDFHEKWVHQTISQNGVLVDGLGQLPHSAKARGRIVRYALQPEWDYVVGDGREAYEGRLSLFRRHALFLKPGVIVVFDELAAPKPVSFQFMLHALSPFEELPQPGSVAGAKSSLTHATTASTLFHVQRPNAGITVEYLPATPLKFRQWEGFEPKPVLKDFPNQWHLEAGTLDKRERADMLTLFLPHPGKAAPEFSAERFESTTAVGIRIRIGEEQWLLGFCRTGVSGKAMLDGIGFNGPVLVQKLE